MQLLTLTLTLTLIVSAYAQGETTTPNPGVAYGGLCNGFLLQCNRHQETVLCMNRTPNATIGADTCETGLGVDVGRCQCRRNCGATSVYEEDGEFDADQDRCVGLVGKACSALNTHCTLHAACNLITSVCTCNLGYTPTPDGLRCTAVTLPTTTARPPTTTAQPSTPGSA